MEIAAYGRYRITPGRWNPWNADDLRAMRIADARIDAEWAKQQAEQRKAQRRQSPKSTNRYANESPEARAARLARLKAYGKTHRYEINERRKDRLRNDPAYAERRRAQARESYHRTKSLKECPANAATLDDSLDMDHVYCTAAANKTQGGEP